MATKTETLTIKVSAEEKEKIKRMAEEQDRTVSKLLHKLIFESEVLKDGITESIDSDY